MKTNSFIFLCIALLTFSCDRNSSGQQQPENATGIRPWSENPAYWEYKGEPVLLLGATANDNLFQIGHLKSHLDSLQAAGGNYVRNTMSDRDPGDLRAFTRDKQGKYDLKTWNEAYWRKLDSLLHWTSERNIVVQIEIWDRFDHSRQEWLADPFSPRE